MAEFVVKLLDGTVVECETPEAVRKLVSKFAGEIAKAGPGSAGSSPAALKKKLSKTRKRTFRSTGIGPKKRWSLAVYHAALTGQIKNDADIELSKLKKSDPRAFLDKSDEHANFLAWYKKKKKITDDLQAMDTLQSIFDTDSDVFGAIIKEYSGSPKKK